MKPEFKDYAKKIIENAKALGERLKDHGFILQGNGTENHLLLVKVDESFGINGKFYEKALDLVGLTLNVNALPGDKGGAFKPGGVRLGTPAITTRGMGISEMEQIGDWMKEVVDLCVSAKDFKTLEKDYKKDLEKIHSEVIKMASKFPVPSI